MFVGASARARVCVRVPVRKIGSRKKGKNRKANDNKRHVFSLSAMSSCALLLLFRFSQSLLEED